MITGPCKGCPDRARACWDTCPRYADFKQQLAEMHEREWKDKNFPYVLPTAEETRRRKRKRKYRVKNHD